jgi:hypothetical protein
MNSTTTAMMIPAWAQQMDQWAAGIPFCLSLILI